MPPIAPPVLVEIGSEAGTSRVALRGTSARIGRALDNDIVLDGEHTVSRAHAELRHDGTSWLVRDLGSHNGTHLNGRRLASGEECPLATTDVVTLGTVTLRLVEPDPNEGMTVDYRQAGELHRLVTSLSERERDVLQLVAEGHTDDQIATKLFISVKTVHSHLDRIRDKTGVRRRAELTRVAVRLGLRRG